MLQYIYKYKVFCSTENKYVESWSYDPPIVCPNNFTHTITNDISIVDTRVNNQVAVLQEIVPTGGYYRAESRKMTIPAGQTVNEDLVWNYQISVLNVTLHANSNADDVVNCYVAPNTPVGFLATNANQGGTTIVVTPSVLVYVNIGFIIHINNTPIGECIAIDKDTNTITLDTALPSNYTAGTLVYMTIHNLKNFILSANTKYELGQKTIGASSVPPGAIVRISYKNNSTLVAKTFYFSFEYLY